MGTHNTARGSNADEHRSTPSCAADERHRLQWHVNSFASLRRSQLERFLSSTSSGTRQLAPPTKASFTKALLRRRVI